MTLSNRSWQAALTAAVSIAAARARLPVYGLHTHGYQRRSAQLLSVSATDDPATRTTALCFQVGMTEGQFGYTVRIADAELHDCRHLSDLVNRLVVSAAAIMIEDLQLRGVEELRMDGVYSGEWDRALADPPPPPTTTHAIGGGGGGGGASIENPIHVGPAQIYLGPTHVGHTFADPFAAHVSNHRIPQAPAPDPEPLPVRGITFGKIGE